MCPRITSRLTSQGEAVSSRGPPIGGVHTILLTSHPRGSRQDSMPIVDFDKLEMHCAHYFADFPTRGAGKIMNRMPVLNI